MDVLKLSDGTVEIIADARDFSDLLDRKLGMDVKNWFDNLVSELECLKDENDELLSDIKDLRGA